MSLYNELAQTAQELFKEFGKEREFIRTIGAEVDKTTGIKSDGVKQSFFVNCTAFDYSGKDAGQGTIQGSSIQKGDKKLLIATSAYIPKVNDRVVINGEKYRLLSVVNLAPADVSVMYEAQARK